MCKGWGTPCSLLSTNVSFQINISNISILHTTLLIQYLIARGWVLMLASSWSLSLKTVEASTIAMYLCHFAHIIFKTFVSILGCSVVCSCISCVRFSSSGGGSGPDLAWCLAWHLPRAHPVSPSTSSTWHLASRCFPTFTPLLIFFPTTNHFKISTI